MKQTCLRSSLAPVAHLLGRHPVLRARLFQRLRYVFGFSVASDRLVLTLCICLCTRRLFDSSVERAGNFRLFQNDRPFGYHALHGHIRRTFSLAVKIRERDCCLPPASLPAGRTAAPGTAIRSLWPVIHLLRFRRRLLSLFPPASAREIDRPRPRVPLHFGHRRFHRGLARRRYTRRRLARRRPRNADGSLLIRRLWLYVPSLLLNLP